MNASQRAQGPWPGEESQTLSGASPSFASLREVEERLGSAIENDELNLPILPDVVAKVLAAAGDEKTDAKKLAELVRCDPTVAAHVLRVTNSPLYRGSSPIVSLQHAVARLGTSRLRDVLLLVARQTTSFFVRARAEALRDDFRAAVVSALFAQEIARLRRSNVEDAFLGGLLHDVGRPIVLQELLDIAHELDVTLPAPVEKRMLDDTHAIAGAKMVEAWKLPGELALVVRHHHSPAAAGPAMKAAAVVALADACTRFALGRKDVMPAKANTGNPLLQMLDLYPDDLLALVARSEELIELAGGLV